MSERLTDVEREAMEAARNGPAAMLLQVHDAWHACEVMFRAGYAARESVSLPNEDVEAERDHKEGEAQFLEERAKEAEARVAELERELAIERDGAHRLQGDLERLREVRGSHMATLEAALRELAEVDARTITVGELARLRKQARAALDASSDSLDAAEEQE